MSAPLSTPTVFYVLDADGGGRFKTLAQLGSEQTNYLPVTTAERDALDFPTGSVPLVYNSDTSAFEGKIGGTWYPMATQAYADALVVGLWDDRGNYDASVNTFPATGGSGTAGAVNKGDIWTASVAGTLGGVAVAIGDTIRAIVNTPAQTASNWAISEANFGYTAENVVNKATDFSVVNNTLYPSEIGRAHV